MTSALLLFFGRGGPSEIETRLDTIKIAIGTSVLARSQQAGFAPLVAVTADDEAAGAFSAAGAAVVAPRTEPFHFGEELRGIARERRLERICAIGAGAGALFTVAELRSLREELEQSEALVLSNNYYSADLVAFTPASALNVIELPATDNPLPRRLHQQGGLSSRQLDRSAATLLDVDTPADAAVLKRHPACPDLLRGLDTWERELGQRIDALMRLVVTPDKELVVAGRVGAPVWSYLESQTACRVRMLAEERGMQAAGRDVSGDARTALGFLYEEIGPERFFALYFLSGIAGALLSFVFAPYAPIIGASGAVYGVMLAFARFWPRDQILIWGVIPKRAKLEDLLLDRKTKKSPKSLP